MGLDNGICLKIKDFKKFGDTSKLYSIFDFCIDEGQYELLYWRKCYNIRTEILDLLRTKDLTWTEEDTVCSFDLDTFNQILDMLAKCYNKKWWNENDDTIWSWKEVRRNYPKLRRKAKRVAKYLAKKDPDSYELFFYDSY